jgi:hypothetical protein
LAKGQIQQIDAANPSQSFRRPQRRPDDRNCMNSINPTHFCPQRRVPGLPSAKRRDVPSPLADIEISRRSQRSVKIRRPALTRRFRTRVWRRLGQ